MDNKPKRQLTKEQLEKFNVEELKKGVEKDAWIALKQYFDGKGNGTEAKTAPCLERSTSEWIWFQEADFFCKKNHQARSPQRATTYMRDIIRSKPMSSSVIVVPYCKFPFMLSDKVEE